MADEVSNAGATRPHVLLLGAGASKAALPNGDRKGRSLPLLRDLASELQLLDLFPEDLRSLASEDFESAYSILFELGDPRIQELDDRTADFFASIRIPDQPNLYDYLLLCLRDKDAIFTFNWDPLLVQSRLRLAKLGVSRFPRLHFLHGNVAIGYCIADDVMGVANRGWLRGSPCRKCGEPFSPTRLLFPVEKKDYQGDAFTAGEWKIARMFLEDCLMFTIFGYSAPKTDVEAIRLLKEAWGDVEQRQFEQVEIISRPDCDAAGIRETWSPFIHTHHYDVFGSFFESWIANHPRRTIEAFRSQYLEAQFISNHPVPVDITDLAELVDWFEPLFVAEDSTINPDNG